MATVSEVVSVDASLAVVFREKDLTSSDRRELGLEVAEVVHEAGKVFAIASDDALAADLGAGFVHLAAGDAANDLTIPFGRSCHDARELSDAATGGAAYAVLSPVFPTSSKPGYGPTLGLTAFGALVRSARLPVYALGGVDADNAGDCVLVGAAGVAVMGAVMAAESPRTVVEALS